MVTIEYGHERQQWFYGAALCCADTRDIEALIDNGADVPAAEKDAVGLVDRLVNHYCFKIPMENFEQRRCNTKIERYNISIRRSV